MSSFIFIIIILSLVTGWLFSSQTFPCCQYFSDSAPVSCCLRWVLAQQSWIALRLRQTTSTAPPGCEESSPAIKGMRRGTTDFRFEDHSNTCKTYQPVLPKHIISEDGEGDHFRDAHGDVFKCQFNNKNIYIYINNHQPHYSIVDSKRNNSKHSRPSTSFHSSTVIHLNSWESWGCPEGAGPSQHVHRWWEAWCSCPAGKKHTIQINDRKNSSLYTLRCLLSSISKQIVH